MSSGVLLTRGPTSPAHDFFELMFQGTDMLSSYWQPYLKGAGRWQLEVAQFGARQTRAWIALSHQLAKARTPDDVSHAYRDYWNNVNACFEDASRNIAAAVVRASPQNIVLDMPQPSRKRAHDTLELIDITGSHRITERKVA